MSLTDNPVVAIITPLWFLAFSLVVAIPPLLLHLALHPFTYLDPSKPLIAHLKAIREKLFFYSWRYLSPIIDKGDAAHKRPLLAKAHGTVLEVGPGVGDNVKYYNRSAVTRLVLVEPNTSMHPLLRTKANRAGFLESDGSLLILACGAAASDEKALRLAGVGERSLDSVVCIHVLCGIPRPAEAIELYRRLLKPDGYFGFYEHVRSDQAVIAQAQAVYTRWVWQHLADGCCLDRPTGAWIVGGPEAADGGALVTGLEMANAEGHAAGKVGRRWSTMWIRRPEDQPVFSAVPHVMGWAIKAR